MPYFLGVVGLYLVLGILMYLRGGIMPFTNRPPAYNKQSSFYISPIKMILLSPLLPLLNFIFAIVDRFLHIQPRPESSDSSPPINTPNREKQTESEGVFLPTYKPSRQFQKIPEIDTSTEALKNLQDRTK